MRPTTVPRHRRRRLLAVNAMTSVTVLGLTGCTAGSETTSAATSPTAFAPDPHAADGAPEELTKYYQQELEFQDCHDGLRCANLEVPLDYAEPETQTIEIAVVDRPATGTKRGNLVTNPGGPGVSGVDFVQDTGEQIFSATVREHYDLIGFDPRGVQNSAPVTCLSDQQIDTERQQSLDLDNDNEFTQAAAESYQDAEQCQAKTGPVLGHVDTGSVVQDMDILRAALGEGTLDYFGFSYGTKLGYRYADMFTDRVGRFVLDGAMQPGLSSRQMALDQGRAFETEFAQFAKKCAADRCELGGTADAVVAQVRKLNDQLADNPAEASDGRLVSGAEFNSGLSLAMYDPALWPTLEKALAKADSGNMDPMLTLADYAADRDPKTGKYTSNAMFAFAAVNCLDYPTSSDKSEMREAAKELEKASPTFGRYLGYGDLLCSQWPYDAVGDPQPIAVQTSTPIVVVGTTRDPATPYRWAKALTGQLENSVLLSYNGDGHTAYGRSNSCVTNTVDDYLVHGTVPDDDVTC